MAVIVLTKMNVTQRGGIDGTGWTKWKLTSYRVSNQNLIHGEQFLSKKEIFVRCGASHDLKSIDTTFTLRAGHYKSKLKSNHFA
jgi:hypothetical protein